MEEVIIRKFLTGNGDGYGDGDGILTKALDELS